MIEQASKVQAPGSGEVAVVEVPDPTHVQPLLTLQTRVERANNPLYYDSSQQAAVVLSSREKAMQVREFLTQKVFPNRFSAFQKSRFAAVKFMRRIHKATNQKVG